MEIVQIERETETDRKRGPKKRVAGLPAIEAPFGSGDG
jgi:hypothetical protein